MLLRMLFAGFAAVVMTASAAEAATGWTTGAVNLRTGPGTGYAKIMAMPAGSQVEVLDCASWWELLYAGHHGWASANYISVGGPAPIVRPPMPPAVYWDMGALGGTTATTPGTTGIAGGTTTGGTIVRASGSSSSSATDDMWRAAP